MRDGLRQSEVTGHNLLHQPGNAAVPGLWHRPLPDVRDRVSRLREELLLSLLRRARQGRRARKSQLIEIPERLRPSSASAGDAWGRDAGAQGCLQAIG